MGSNHSIQKCNFEDIQNIISNSYINKKNILINTLCNEKQECLITGTISIDKEETIINSIIDKKQEISIFIYGENCNDKRTYKKYMQLQELGFNNVFVYSGGLFEWLCLQDIYGDDEFPTTTKELDILKYKPISSHNKLYITN